MLLRLRKGTYPAAMATATAISCFVLIQPLGPNPGTVLDTETLVLEVVHHVVQSHGKVLSPEAATLALGMRPIEAWQAVASTLNITGQSPQDLYEQSEPLLQDRWHEAPLLPGVARLVAHLQQHGVPLALATSTPRATLNRKLHQRADMQAAFKVACCGDEVVNGKPAPDCFLQLAQRLGLPPTECLVIEDSPAGVAAATAAGMRVVAVPSMLSNGKPCDLYDKPVPDRCSGCISLLPSLLDFRPEQYGLPAFTGEGCGGSSGRVAAGSSRGRQAGGAGAWTMHASLVPCRGCW